VKIRYWKADIKQLVKAGYSRERAIEVLDSVTVGAKDDSRLMYLLKAVEDHIALLPKYRIYTRGRPRKTTV
jgi:hypothetical protein